MILHDLVGEKDEAYVHLEGANGVRHYDFLRSLVITALRVNRPVLSHQIIKALNYHAIACLHPYAGEYRPCAVDIGGDHQPPPPYAVPFLMDDFINGINSKWDGTDSIVLASRVLWGLNHIHPFINGNGRTARAAAYFVICVKHGSWLPGGTILPELLRRKRDQYVSALKIVDQSQRNRMLNVQPVHELVCQLLDEQLNSVPNNNL